MKSLSENIRLTASQKLSGFSLVEITTALIILALVCSSVLAVINRCLRSTADLTSRMQAFEVARENMENLLSQNAVEEKVDYGNSDKYPHIDWETNVETFYEPLTDQMWVRAVCSAQYTDTEGEEQSVKLSHWLTSVTTSQLIKIMEDMKKEKLAERKEEKEKEKEPTQPEDEGEELDTAVETFCGYTREELEGMDSDKAWEIFINCDEF